MENSFPLEIWSEILSHIAILGDINCLFQINKTFYNLVPKSIKIIQESRYISQIPLQKWINLQECHIMTEINSKEDFSRLLSMKVVHIATSTDIINRTWNLPDNYEKKFHVFYTQSSKRFPYSRCFSYYEGIIDIETNNPVIHEMMKLLSATKIMTFREGAVFNSHQLIDYFSPNPIGIRLSEYNPHYCLCFIVNNPVIRSIGVDNITKCHMDFDKFGVQCYLNGRANPCLRDINIDLPVQYTDFSKLLECFPNLKSALIITSSDTLLPIISGIRIRGYDPECKLYFN